MIATMDFMLHEQNSVDTLESATKGISLTAYPTKMVALTPTKNTKPEARNKQMKAKSSNLKGRTSKDL